MVWANIFAAIGFVIIGICVGTVATLLIVARSNQKKESAKIENLKKQYESQVRTLELRIECLKNENAYNRKDVIKLEVERTEVAELNYSFELDTPQRQFIGDENDVMDVVRNQFRKHLSEDILPYVKFDHDRDIVALKDIYTGRVRVLKSDRW